ncbi:type II secretion system protein [Nautilia sp. PV-1]|uniref:prepilin-type N-terminal cleavage/methylation domain-containing protein n=1 Tax=Nautilia sp. PV-1 TaxID=2579250 RepID=UPI000FD8D50B|nr:prepilin-type N-terminal cleavage/methylation domain-containing protein [Nautilia sp. PV-1]AZV46805.1 type II secretion system protein [Nautilia sp. PV-1]
MKKAFTLLEIIFVIVIIGILAGVAVPRYFALGQKSHEAVLMSFVKMLNRTTGEDLWSKSISENKNGSITHLENSEGYQLLSRYIEIPPEVNASSIDLTRCGNETYNTVMTVDVKVAGEEYNITCKDGTAKSAPYFRLIRLKDGKILVNR